jgi:hypothetical protein
VHKKERHMSKTSSTADDPFEVWRQYLTKPNSDKD